MLYFALALLVVIAGLLFAIRGQLDGIRHQLLQGLDVRTDILDRYKHDEPAD